METIIFESSLVTFSVRSMLVTDVGDEMCWWQLWGVSDGFGHFGHQHLLTLASGSNIKKMSLKSVSVTNKQKSHQLHQHLCHWLFLLCWWFFNVRNLSLLSSIRYQQHKLSPTSVANIDVTVNGLNYLWEMLVFIVVIRTKFLASRKMTFIMKWIFEEFWCGYSHPSILQFKIF